MAISNSSGKNSSSNSDLLEAFESGSLHWTELTRLQQSRLVQCFAPKIRYIALRLKTKLPKQIELDELLSSGSLGLMEAFGKFQPELGVRFETFAENRIRGAMLDELRRLDWFPRSLRQRVRQLDEARWHIENNTGRPATEEELQEHTGLSLKDVRQALEALQNQVCLSLEVVQESLGIAQDVTENGPYSVTEHNALINKVASLIATLTPREKLVLSLYYTDELNMREAAMVMGVTEGRVSQLHAQALTRLRRAFALLDR